MTVLHSTSPSMFVHNPWLDSSICGNGRVGAAITGAYCNERLLINHSDLKHGGYTGVLQDVSDKLVTQRKVFADGKVIDAEKTLAGEFAKKNYKPSPELPLPVATMTMDFFQEGQIADYSRMTDMESAEVSVMFKASGTTFERRMFVDRKTDVIAFTATHAGPQKLRMRLGINSDGKTGETIKCEGGYLMFAAKNTATSDYGIVARVIVGGGEAAMDATGMTINNADTVTIFTKAFISGGREAQFKELRKQLGEIKHSYDKLASANESVHKKLFAEAQFELTTEKGEETNTAALVALAADNELSPGLAVRLWNFAKYIAICSGGPLVTSGGLWVGAGSDTNAVFNLNNGAQLTYGSTMLSVNPDSLLRAIDYFDGYAQDLKKNAARVFGAKGYFVPNITSPGSALFGAVDAKTLHFIASPALAANLFYNYFLATADQKILKQKIFPFMTEVFNFYSDFLKLDSAGLYTTIPSYSPDSTPGNIIGGKPLQNFAFATNSTIDFLAIGALLDNLIHAAEILGQRGSIPTWTDMKRKIPVVSVNEKANLREYSNSAFIDGANNCGALHTYGLYPLKNFSFNDFEVAYKPAIATPAGATISVRTASANAVRARMSGCGHVQTARTLAIYAAQLANAGDELSTRDAIIRLLNCFAPSGLGLSNDWRGSGFTKNTPPSIDIGTNLGFANAITECLVQSDKRNLRILPVMLPGFDEGAISGITTDFMAKINMDWSLRRGKLTIKIIPKTTCTIDIFFPDDFRKPRGKEIKLERDNSLRNVKLTANKAWSIEF